MASNKSGKRQAKDKTLRSYEALLDWLEKAEQHQGSKESRLFIRNAENYVKSLQKSQEPIDISHELDRLQRLKKML
ncbi:MAG: hypothetical protein ACFB0A_04500 [Croceivirga sp.]